MIKTLQIMLVLGVIAGVFFVFHFWINRFPTAQPVPAPIAVATTTPPEIKKETPPTQVRVINNVSPTTVIIQPQPTPVQTYTPAPTQPVQPAPAPVVQLPTATPNQINPMQNTDIIRFIIREDNNILVESSVPLSFANTKFSIGDNDLDIAISDIKEEKRDSIFVYNATLSHGPYQVSGQKEGATGDGPAYATFYTRVFGTDGQSLFSKEAQQTKGNGYEVSVHF